MTAVIEVSNAGQFVATIILWPDDADADPTNRLSSRAPMPWDVTDSDEYGAGIDLTIAEPSISVTPDIAGPRDYITITGMNWAVDNLDSEEQPSIFVTVEAGKAPVVPGPV